MPSKIARFASLLSGRCDDPLTGAGRNRGGARFSGDRQDLGVSSGRSDEDDPLSTAGTRGREALAHGIHDQNSMRKKRISQRVKASHTGIQEPSILAYPVIPDRRTPSELGTIVLTRMTLP